MRENDKTMLLLSISYKWEYAGFWRKMEADNSCINKSKLVAKKMSRQK